MRYIIVMKPSTQKNEHFFLFWPGVDLYSHPDWTPRIKESKEPSPKLLLSPLLAEVSESDFALLGLVDSLTVVML